MTRIELIDYLSAKPYAWDDLGMPSAWSYVADEDGKRRVFNRHDLGEFTRIWDVYGPRAAEPHFRNNMCVEVLLSDDKED